MSNLTSVYIGICIILTAVILVCATDYMPVIAPPYEFLRPKQPECVSSCRGLPDGDYPSCEGCLFFTTCSNGRTYPARVCSWFGGLYWNNKYKLCDWHPSTCFKKKSENSPNCIHSDECREMPDGDYQSCTGCMVYITCSGGRAYDGRPCPWLLVWNEHRKRCEWNSPTCKPSEEELEQRQELLRKMYGL
ncbi:probable chitinase 10 [Dreissena polymorpha]|uniref:Chitin-binding type-2 domain-containing protein n=1 Tax=Dreissena polymorpha TaxID=45954 RepID=A0A9D4BNG3_DREPO|nr:probable chitinase 10 [Dreissena polymorpha]KAH3699557.1 hypothetical protein DPMN_074515 [Dreissena polymorpha]